MDQSNLTEEQSKQLQERLKDMSPEELQEFQKQQCIFCQIIAEKIPSKKVYEDDICIVAMDIAPAAQGHLLIVPKEHYIIMPQVPDQVLGHLTVIAKRLSQIMLRSLRVTGTTFFVANGAIAGQRAQHFLVHLIPRKEGDHVLNLQEKVISRDLVQKVKTAVESKLIEITGLEKPKAAAAEIESSPEDEINNKSVSDKSKEKITTKEKNPEPRSKKISKKTKTSKPEKDNGVQLDDIANLFK